MKDKKLVVLLAVSVLCSSVPIVRLLLRERKEVPKIQVQTIAKTVPQKVRPVYKYSVVPGGVWNDSDAKKANGIYGDHVTCKASSHADRFYVEYSKDGHLGFTSYLVTIPKGEMICEDWNGLTWRARCGNLLSERRFPKRPNEPVAGVMDQLEQSATGVVELGHGTVGDVTTVTGSSTNDVVIPEATELPFVTDKPFITLGSIGGVAEAPAASGSEYSNGFGASSYGPMLLSSSGPVGLVNAPEPGTMFLLGAGLVSLALIRKRV